MTHCNETLAYATPSALADGPWSQAAKLERKQAIDVDWEEAVAVEHLTMETRLHTIS